MKRLACGALFLGAAVLAQGIEAVAEDNVGTCGWGSKLFEGQRGAVPQVLAVTTNGFLGNQTFGISSGTSGCTQDGVIRSNWRTVLFIEENRESLAAEMSRGEGESLSALATLLGMNERDREAFFEMARANYAAIFSADDVTSKEVVASLKKLLEREKGLARYAGAV